MPYSRQILIATVGICTIGFFLYGIEINNPLQAKDASSPHVQSFTPPENWIIDAKPVGPKRSSVAFVGGAFSADNPKDAIALLEVAKSPSQPFQVGDLLTTTLRLKEIQAAKVVISSTNGDPDFDVSLTYGERNISQASNGESSAKVSRPATEIQPLPGFVKSESIIQPRDEKAVAANNAAFLSAVQNMKQN